MALIMVHRDPLNIKRWYLILLGVCLGVASCGGTGSTGPYLKVLNVQATIVVNTKGQVVLETSLNIPFTPPNPVGEFGWQFAYETVLYDANSKSNTLVLLWQADDGSYWTTEYDMGQPFTIEFKNDQWVRQMSNEVGDGSLVVAVEIRSEESYSPPTQRVEKSASEPPQEPPRDAAHTPVEVDKAQPEIADCPGAPPARLSRGMQAYVCTKVDRLIVHSQPKSGSKEIVRLYPGQEVTILKGPVCDIKFGWNYYRIRTEQNTLGWAAEGGDEEDPYWLCPK